MVAQTAQESVTRAKRQTTCTPGMCLANVRTWLDILPHEPDAKNGWINAKFKHPDDRHPPNGAPCFYRGGDHWHIVLSHNKKHGKMRSTDAPSSGVVSTQDIEWVENNWGYEYLGWTEDLNLVEIPYLRPDEAKWQDGDVFVAKLHLHQQNSDSVKRLSKRLMNHPDMPGSHRPKTIHKNYNHDVLEAVRYWQRNIMPKEVNGPTDGTEMSNQQANRLFGDNYNVIEEGTA